MTGLFSTQASPTHPIKSPTEDATESSCIIVFDRIVQLSTPGVYCVFVDKVP
jgi:hypothetical protein